jgi:hypothetical protein
MSIRDILDAFDRAEHVRLVIFDEPGNTPWMAHAAEDILLKEYERHGIFQRGPMLVRIIRSAGTELPRTLIRPSGSLIVIQATVTMLIDILNGAIEWRRRVKDSDKNIDCPLRVAHTLLSRTGLWRLPHLLGVVQAPTIRPDGTILTARGYDEETGLFLESNVDWLPVRDTPTKAQAEEALKALFEPLSEFPFVTAADLAVVLSAILTALIRRLMFSAPLHGFTAPTQASGKSLLADVISNIATGHDIASMPIGGGDDEVRKKVTAVLLLGDLLVNIDNILVPLKSDALAMVLSQPRYSDRILGRTEQVELPTNVLFLATGNNLRFAGDLTSRALLSRIDAKREKPEERTFAITDLRQHVRDHRRQLVHAALTVMRAYRVAGCPKQPINPFGRFEDWSDKVRSALVWLGQADPCQTRERITIDDPDRGAIEAVLKAWHRIFGDTPTPLREIVEAISADDLGDNEQTLKEAVLNVASAYGNSTRLDTRRLAAWCQQNLDRIIGGLRLSRSAIKRNNAVAWMVVDEASSHSSNSRFRTDEGRSSSNRPSESSENDSPNSSNYSEQPVQPPLDRRQYAAVRRRLQEARLKMAEELLEKWDGKSRLGYPFGFYLAHPAVDSQ